MATTTTNLGLTKPAGNEDININQINTNMDIIDQRYMAAAMGTGATNLSGEILYNCTGSVTSHIRYHISGKILVLEGRCTIDNYKRTGANPGIQFYLPNNVLAHKTVSVYAGTNGLYDGNTKIDRPGELTTVSVGAGGSLVTVNTTESYDNMGSADKTYTRAVFLVFPIFIELR